MHGPYKKNNPKCKDDPLFAPSYTGVLVGTNFLIEIKKHQKSTDLLIEALPFKRLVKENGGFPFFGLLNIPI